MSKIEKQKENVNTLLTLIKENPDLEIIPMVGTEVVGDDSYSTWAGNWGNAELDEYYCSDERIYFKSLDCQELVEDYMDKYNEAHPTNEEEIERWAEQKVDNLPWKRAIIVNITAH